jgi:hypothetical protein
MVEASSTIVVSPDSVVPFLCDSYGFPQMSIPNAVNTTWLFPKAGTKVTVGTQRCVATTDAGTIRFTEAGPVFDGVEVQGRAGGEEIVQVAPMQTGKAQTSPKGDSGLDSSAGERVTVRHILVGFGKRNPDDALKAEKLQEIRRLRERLVAGENFAALARRHSDCGSRATGGRLPPFGRGTMVSPFEEAAFSQASGEVGAIVETVFGYHIIQVLDRSSD